MRLIDADRLLDYATAVQKYNGVGPIVTEMLKEYLKHQPTITDTTDTTKAESSRNIGLYTKYAVYDNEDGGSVVTDCFVLRPDKDPAALIALRTYAVVTDNVELASDIINWCKNLGMEE